MYYYLLKYLCLFLLGKHYDKLPTKEEVNKDLAPLLFEAITVNCNYTSKIDVSIIIIKSSSNLLINFFI